MRHTLRHFFFSPSLSLLHFPLPPFFFFFSDHTSLSLYTATVFVCKTQQQQPNQTFFFFPDVYLLRIIRRKLSLKTKHIHK